MTVAALLIAYLIGSLNAGILVSRRLGRDVRDRDFAGASGTTRQFGLRTGVAVGLLDAARGAIAVVIAALIAPDAAGLAAAAVVAGHCWPVFFAFRGGQGLAPAIGAFAVAAPRALGLALAVAAAAILAHVTLRLKPAVRLDAVPFSAIFAVTAALIAAWTLDGPAGGTAVTATAAVLVARGAQVLLARSTRAPEA